MVLLSPIPITLLAPLWMHFTLMPVLPMNVIRLSECLVG